MNLSAKPHEARSFPMLESKVARVTGAGSGIGKAEATAMARHGALVVVTDLDADKAAAVVMELENEGDSATSAGLDVADDEAVFAKVNRVMNKYGRLDVLHSHAEYQIEGKLEDVPVDEIDMSSRLNVRSHFVAARSAVGHMRDQGGGSIIIKSSNSVVQYDREMIAYATTKHAVVAMTRQMAADYTKRNVRFNAGFEKQMGGRKKLEGYVSQAILMGVGARLKKWPMQSCSLPLTCQRS